LQVARELGLPVVLLRRPSLPPVQREFASLDGLWQVLQQATELPPKRRVG